MLALTGCEGTPVIKINKAMLKMMVAGSNTISSEITYADSCQHQTSIPYIDDYITNGTSRQVLDIYYAKENRKNAVLIDIHGGFYVAGDRRNNRTFTSEFLKKGYDVVLIEYRLCDGTIDVQNELEDCATALDYLTDNAQKLRLNKNRMFLTGDSAGGHLALYMAEGGEDHSLPVHPRHFVAKGVLLNCPAYDFGRYGNLNGGFTEDALAWFIGPRYSDPEWMKSLSPRTYLSSYTGPLFVSTCTNDFIRSEALTLKTDCDAAGREIQFVDIESGNMHVGHIHNVSEPFLAESQQLNDMMADFLKQNL